LRKRFAFVAGNDGGESPDGTLRHPANAARATDDDAAACAIHFFLMTTQSFTDETL
jgi:hypothetical protein